jgi:predicted nucleic acid-binding protein
MSKRIYIESTIPSYLAARPCRDIIQTARQQLTHLWWQENRSDFDLCISEMVIDEITAGDPIAAEKRLALVDDLPLLDITDSVRQVAKDIMLSGLLPERATRDAIHIAVASVHCIDILLTWNCRHIANAKIMKEIRKIVAESGHELSTLCTPEELVGD